MMKLWPCRGSATIITLALLFWCSLQATLAAEEEENHHESCGLYLAESSTSSPQEPKW
jgi:hypothetical protein